MKLEELNKKIELHKKWISNNSEGERMILSGVDLRRADLSEANIDYSCWPIWCRSLDAIVDRRIAAQLAYHLCRLDCDDAEYIKARNAIVDFANQFHRVDECGVLERI